MDNAPFHIEASAVKRFTDHLGSVETDIELIRFDDCWRSLISTPLTLDGPGTLAWDDRWGSDAPPIFYLNAPHGLIHKQH